MYDQLVYYYRNQDIGRTLDPGAARSEMAAQVDRAVAAGLDLTHVDGHMFSMLTASLVGHYVELGFTRGLPVLMTRQPQWVAKLSEDAIAAWESQGLPVFDHLREMPLNGHTT